MMRNERIGTWCIAAGILCTTSGAAAQSAPAAGSATAAGDHRVSLIYTGRSLGALGVLRDPDEHELLVEEASRANLPLRLATYVCWRSPQVTIFSPTGDLTADDLGQVVEGGLPNQNLGHRAVLRSNNAVLLQYPDAADRDLLALTRGNPRASRDFPDLVSASMAMRLLHTPDGREIFVVAAEEAALPADVAAWTAGEVNRIEVGGATLFELPVNLSEIGPRATLVAQALADAEARASHSLVIDLGARDGDLGVERVGRARIDYTMLTRMGYTIVVPYEFELALGTASLRALQKEFPALRFLASNIAVKGSASPFERRHIADVNGVKIGLLALVDPELRTLLAKASLAEFTVEPPLEAAEREIAALRAAGADAVIALSNLHPRDNNFLAREVAGLDAIVADLHVRWSPEEIRTSVELPGRPRVRPGSPALVARGFANGLGVGALELRFRTGEDGRPFLAGLEHQLRSVTDRTPPDVPLVTEVRRLARAAERPRGEVLLPAFPELVQRRPQLRDFDGTARQGRISKKMWEEFVARLLRHRSAAEVAIVRKLPHFPPAIGDLHDRELRAWLWTEDAIVALDLSGGDLKALLAADTRGDLVTAGIDRRRWTVHGRRILDQTFYRVATTDLLIEGARAAAFDRARRVARAFHVNASGALARDAAAKPMPLRDFVLSELTRMRRDVDSERYLRTLAAMLDVDPPFEPLFTFSFDRPTVFSSFNRSVNTERFGAVPESRVVAPNSQVIGVTGRFALSQDRRQLGIDTTVSAAFSRTSLTSIRTGRTSVAETADDFKVDFTLRRKRRAEAEWQPQPFLRATFDSEFTQTTNPFTGTMNRRQDLMRMMSGISLAPLQRWTTLEAGLTLERDIAYDSVEVGVEATANFRRPMARFGQVTYRWDNTFSYFLPTRTDDLSDLGMTYRTIHELLIPLVDELSLSVASDIYLFRGKVAITNKIGASALVRIGLTYDRLWKPRYQPFF